MTAGSDRAFGYAAKPGNAVHCIARKLYVIGSGFRVSAAMAKPTIDPPNEPIDRLVRRSGEPRAA
jgi:hypothetical protein